MTEQFPATELGWQSGMQYGDACNTVQDAQ